jgi:hypothetical protein
MFVKGSTVLSGQVIRMTMAPAIIARITAKMGGPIAAPYFRALDPSLDARERC